MELKGARLATILNTAIDGMTDDDTSRGDVISQMARAAGIASGTVNQILAGDINCPPLNRLEGFADVLGVSMSRLQGAAESDGCEYVAESGKALHPCLVPTAGLVIAELKSLKEKFFK